MKTVAFVLAACILAFGADALAQGSKPAVDPKSIKLKHAAPDTTKKQAVKSAAKTKAASRAPSSSSSLMSPQTSAQLVDLVKTLVVASQPQPVVAAPVAAAVPAPIAAPAFARPSTPVAHVTTPAAIAPSQSMQDAASLVRYQNDAYGISAVPPPGFTPAQSPQFSLAFTSPGGEILSVLGQQVSRDDFRSSCGQLGQFELDKGSDSDLCFFVAPGNAGLVASQWLPSGHVAAASSKLLGAKTLAKLVTTFSSTLRREELEPGAAFDAQLER